MTVKFAIVGAGKVGTALARLLAESGYDFAGAASRSLASAEAACRFARAGHAAADAPTLTRDADLVFLTTPDDAIAAVCAGLAKTDGFRAGAIIAHCSGALPSSVLQPARAAGAHVGSLHPLQSFASADQAFRTLPGSYCCIEGDPEAVEVLQEAARAMRTHVMVIPSEAKPLYHAAACVASNFLVALQHAALKLEEAAGIDRAEALHALLPLVKGTVANMEKVGIPAALTGPIARGDVETVRMHLDALGAATPDLLPLYRVMARQTVEVALAKGTIGPDRAAELLALLDKRIP